MSLKDRDWSLCEDFGDFSHFPFGKNVHFFPIDGWNSFSSGCSSTELSTTKDEELKHGRNIAPR